MAGRRRIDGRSFRIPRLMSSSNREATLHGDNVNGSSSSEESNDVDDSPQVLSSSVAQRFGRQDYWESFYDKEESDFSWYSSWEEMEPFVMEWVPPSLDDNGNNNGDNISGNTVLIPGIGSDASLLQSMYEAGYTQLAAFDYAPSAVSHVQSQLAGTPLGNTIDLSVADATQTLPYPANSVRLVVDKGTLDAISIAGKTRDEKRDMVRKSVVHLQQVLAPGGIFWSLSGICTDILRDDMDDCWQGWEVCADSTSDLVTTSDGYTSNNLDGDLLVWRKPTDHQAQE